MEILGEVRDITIHRGNPEKIKIRTVQAVNKKDGEVADEVIIEKIELIITREGKIIVQ